MSGLFSTFNVAKRGMQAQQTALHVISHNVANANTEGYSAQRVNLKTTDPFGMPSLTTSAEPGQLGTGVKVDSITRARDEFIDYYIRREKSTLEDYKVREQFLSTIETIFAEPSDTGIATLMSRYWDAWSGLSVNPESQAQRELVRSTSEALCNGLKHNYTQLENLEANISDYLNNKIFETSSILRQLADLNKQIKVVTIDGKNPNDLLDRRDLLLDQLSEMFGIEIERKDYNVVNVYIKTKENNVPGELIINGANIEKKLYYVDNSSLTIDGVNITKADFPISFDASKLPNKISMTLYENGDINKKEDVEINIGSLDDFKKYFNVQEDGSKITVLNIMPHILTGKDENNIEPLNLTTGSMHGLEKLSFEINDYKNQLNNLARGIAIAVNTIHSGSNDGSTGKNFFDISVETHDKPAKYIKLDKDILANIDNIRAGKEGTFIGNGERALMISQLRNTRMELLNIKDRDDFINSVKADLNNLQMTSNNGGTTLDNYFKATISQLGGSNQEARRMANNQQNLVDQLILRRESVSGVSLDEEMANMLQFQRAYEANAKMIQVIDQLLDVVVNGLLKR